MNAALPRQANRFGDLSDCAVERILTDLAFRNRAVLAGLLPRLVRPAGPDGRFVEPDRVARAAVSSLSVKGAEVRALNDLGEADTGASLAVASLALALAGGAAAATETVAGYYVGAAAAGTDAAIGLFQAGRDVHSFLTFGGRLDDAVGVTPVMGDAAFQRELSRAPRLSNTMMSVLFSGVSIRGARNALKTANVVRGRALAAGLPDLSEETLEGLSRTERAHVAAWAEMVRGNAARLNAMSPTELTRYLAGEPDAARLMASLDRRVLDRDRLRLARMADQPRGTLSADLSPDELSRIDRALVDGGAGVSDAERLIWIDARMSGRLPMRQTGDTLSPARVTETGGEVRLEVPRIIEPDDFDPNKTQILEIELPAAPLSAPPKLGTSPRISIAPGAEAEYGHRLLAAEDLADFAREPRVRITSDPARVRPPDGDVFQPWQEIDGVTVTDALDRRIHYGRIPEAQRIARERQVLALVDEAAAIGNPWARRIQGDIARGQFDIRMDAGLPDGFDGMAVRADDAVGRNAFAILRPTDRAADGSMVLRRPEVVARDLVHEFAHGWRGDPRLIDLHTGSPTPRPRGEYNEIRATLAEGRFLRDAAHARALNGRAFIMPDDSGALGMARELREAGVRRPGAFGQGLEVRRVVTDELVNERYREYYADGLSRFVNLSPEAGGSTIALRHRIEQIDAALSSPELAGLPRNVKAVWRNAALNELIDSVGPSR